MNSLSVSIVVYHSDPAVLGRTLQALEAAVAQAQQAGLLADTRLDIICNDAADYGKLHTQSLSPVMHTGHGNPGYGAAHNMAIRQASTDYHLILNPDAILGEQALVRGLAYLAANPGVAALSPRVTDDHGHKQHLCKRYPAVLDFLLRGFAPSFIKRLFSSRLARYEMRELPESEPTTGIPIISGCFMLFRTQTLQQLNGFDERYFLYFEDFDLSMRVHGQGGGASQLAYVPAVEIVHLGGNSAGKGWQHIRLFARSGWRFYSSWGWRLW